MSVTNKAKDRGQNSKIKRKYTGPYSTNPLKQAPKSFRKELNRDLRAKNSQILKNGRKFGFQDLNFEPFKKTVCWLWW